MAAVTTESHPYSLETDHPPISIDKSGATFPISKDLSISLKAAESRPAIDTRCLTDPHHASLFATTSRLMSCMVSETLTIGLYFPISFTFNDEEIPVNAPFQSPSLANRCSGYVAVLNTVVSQTFDDDTAKSLNPQDILYIIPLVDPPIIGDRVKRGLDGEVYKVSYLDPMDMLPVVYSMSSSKDLKVDRLASRISDNLSEAFSNKHSIHLVQSVDPVAIWRKVAEPMNLGGMLNADIIEEFESSLEMQEWNYNHPPPLPNLESLPIAWEQSIVTGHPVQPVHRARVAYPPVQPLKANVESERKLKNPKIRIVSLAAKEIDCSDVEIWSNTIKPIVKEAFRCGKEPLPPNFDSELPPSRIYIPVHEVQIPSIATHFPSAHIYPIEVSIPALAQQSTRSVLLADGDILPNMSLKLAIGVKLTTAMRTISPNSAFLGPRLCKTVLPLLTYDREKVGVVTEAASVVAKHPDPEIAKHCAAIIRQAPDAMLPSISGGKRKEIVIVTTSLVDWGHSGAQPGVAPVISAFNLNTVEKRIEFLDRYVKLILEAFLPPMMKDGFGFEAHPQNTLARFSTEYPHQLIGFYIRDFGGIKVHLPTLEASCGEKFEGEKQWVKPGHSVLSHDLEDVYARVYSTIVHNHLQQLFRVLGLHHNGVGYDILRNHFANQVPQDHPLYTSWNTDTIPGKAFVRMRIQGMFRFHLHTPYPNLLRFYGSDSKSCNDEVTM